MGQASHCRRLEGSRATLPPEQDLHPMIVGLALIESLVIYGCHRVRLSGSSDVPVHE